MKLSLPSLMVAPAIMFASTTLHAAGGSAADPITFSQTDINAYTSSSYWNASAGTSGAWTLDGGQYYANSGGFTFANRDSTRGRLYIGYSTTGATTHLAFTDAAATMYSTSIAGLAGTTAQVTIQGSSTTWYARNAFMVGESGSGNLSVLGGAKVTVQSGLAIGYNSGASGSTLVSGSGSALAATGMFVVGYAGSGSLSIENNAIAYTTGQIYLGASGGTGTLRVASGGSLIMEGDQTTAMTGYISAGNVFAGNGSVYEVVTGTADPRITLGYYSYTGNESLYTQYGLDSSLTYTILTGNAAVPEPATYALFGGLGALGLALLRRRK